MIERGLHRHVNKSGDIGSMLRKTERRTGSKTKEVSYDIQSERRTCEGGMERDTESES